MSLLLSGMDVCEARTDTRYVVLTFDMYIYRTKGVYTTKHTLALANFRNVLISSSGDDFVASGEAVVHRNGQRGYVIVYRYAS